MLRRSLKIPLAMAGALLLVGSASMAAEVPLDEQAAREKKAIDAMQSANALSVRDGKYIQAREALLKGSGSIRAKVAVWESGTQAWMNGWMSILALVDLRESLSYGQFEAKLRDSLSKQASQVADLSAAANTIKTQGIEALALLSAGPAPGPDAYPATEPYRQLIEGLGSREADLVSAITTVSTMPYGKLATMGEMDSKSRIAVIARLQAALLATGKYPLEQTVKSIQELLAAEKVIDPVLVQLGKTENALDRYALNFQIFHLVDGINDVRKQCADGRATIGAVSGAAGYATAARARLEQLCTAMENHYSSLAELGVGNADLVGAYIETEKAALAAVCKAGPNPPPVCEKLATVAALQPADYQGMDDAQLKFVEYGWSDGLEVARRKGAEQ